MEAAGVVGVGEPVNPLAGGREQGAVAGLAGADPEPDREVSLPGSRRSEEDDVLFAGDEVEGAEVGDQVPFQPAGVVEVELF